MFRVQENVYGIIYKYINKTCFAVYINWCIAECYYIHTHISLRHNHTYKHYLTPWKKHKSFVVKGRLNSSTFLLYKKHIVLNKFLFGLFINFDYFIMFILWQTLENFYTRLGGKITKYFVQGLYTHTISDSCVIIMYGAFQNIVCYSLIFQYMLLCWKQMFSFKKEKNYQKCYNVFFIRATAGDPPQ